MAQVLSAALAGIAARLVCHPLDTIKTVAFTGFAGDRAIPPLAAAGASPATVSAATHSSASSSGSRLAFAHAARGIWQREGLRGMYRGVGVACVGSAPGVAVYLSTYEYVNKCWTHLGERARSGDEAAASSLIGRLAAATPAPVNAFASGLAAEAVSCLVWVPIDVSKERLQSQPPGLIGRYKNSPDAVHRILQHEGVFGLYKGYWSTLGSFGPFSAVYFVTYESLTRQFRSVFPEPGGENAFMVALLSGAGGNIVASLLTNPLELIKTRLQVQRAVLGPSPGDTATGHSQLFTYHYRGLLDGLATVTREAGVRALWRGVGCRMAYTAPNAAFTMAFYESLKNGFA